MAHNSQSGIELYLIEWEALLGLKCSKAYKVLFREEGYLAGYRLCFEKSLGIRWANCPADFAILEQITLARNRDQHPDKIATLRVTHSKRDRSKYPNPFFMHDAERSIFVGSDDTTNGLLSPTLHVSREALLTSIDQVEMLAEWLDDQVAVIKGRGGRPSPAA